MSKIFKKPLQWTSIGKTDPSEYEFIYSGKEKQHTPYTIDIINRFSDASGNKFVTIKKECSFGPTIPYGSPMWYKINKVFKKKKLPRKLKKRAKLQLAKFINTSLRIPYI